MVVQIAAADGRAAVFHGGGQVLFAIQEPVEDFLREMVGSPVVQSGVVPEALFRGLRDVDGHPDVLIAIEFNTR